MTSKSTTTEVSRRPRGGRRNSATWLDRLRSEPVEVSPEQPQVDARRTLECRRSGISGDEAPTVQRGQLPHRDTIARHDESLTAVQLAHDLAAVVSKLPLGYFAGHSAIVARRATRVARHWSAIEGSACGAETVRIVYG